MQLSTPLFQVALSAFDRRGIIAMKRIVNRTFYLLFLISSSSVLAPFSSGQVATGIPKFSSASGGPFDTVNLGNLNVHFAIPVLHKAGRGMPFSYDLSYDSSVWTPVTVSGTKHWQPDSNWGWKGTSEPAGGDVYERATSTPCRQFINGRWQTYYYTVWNT